MVVPDVYFTKKNSMAHLGLVLVSLCYALETTLLFKNDFIYYICDAL